MTMMGNDTPEHERADDGLTPSSLTPRGLALLPDPRLPVQQREHDDEEAERTSTRLSFLQLDARGETRAPPSSSSFSSSTSKATASSSFNPGTPSRAERWARWHDLCAEGELAVLERELHDDDGSIVDAQHLLDNVEIDASRLSAAAQSSSRLGRTLLHVAARHGHASLCALLIQHGASARKADDEGETPLHASVDSGDAPTTRTLLVVGGTDTDPDASDKDGWTALHNAAARGQLAIVQALLETESESSQLDEDGQGRARWARVNKQSKRGYTPLMNAAARGHLPVVQYLLAKHGARAALRDAFGETAYDLAASVFESHIADVLALAEREQALQEEEEQRAGEHAAQRTYNLLERHSTVLVTVFENQRLALPSLGNFAALGLVAPGTPSTAHWTSKALSKRDKRTAFSIPPQVGLVVVVDDDEGEHGKLLDHERPVLRKEVGLPRRGSENTLVLPPAREIRSAGRIGPPLAPPPAATAGPTSSSSIVAPSTSPASASLSALLEPHRRARSSSSASSSRAHPPPKTSQSGAERAWVWLSDWSVDLTSPDASAIDGWSYAASFDASPEWLAEPPHEVRALAQGHRGPRGDGGGGGGGEDERREGPVKFVRRRRWVRVMRRRLDLPDWGFGPDDTGDERGGERDELASDYLARAAFIAGPTLAATVAAAAQAEPAGGDDDDDDARSSTSTERGAAAPQTDKAEMRRTAMGLERAVDVLREGMLDDEDDTRRLLAEQTLEAYLSSLAAIRNSLDLTADALDDDDEFVYDGEDADDAQSVRTTLTRAESSAPAPSSFPHHEAPLPPPPPPVLRSGSSSASVPRVITTAPPAWEPDESAHECRLCARRFTFLNRKHHCRRCGRVVCASCSQHMDFLPPERVVLDPGYYSEPRTGQVYRVRPHPPLSAEGRGR